MPQTVLDYGAPYSEREIGNPSINEAQTKREAKDTAKIKLKKRVVAAVPPTKVPHDSQASFGSIGEEETNKLQDSGMGTVDPEPASATFK